MQIHELHNGQGERLEFDFTVGTRFPKTVVVIGHGVTANKDREWAVMLMDTLVETGIGALRFSFAGNGGSQGEFGASCPSKEADDLRAVLRAVKVAGAERIVYAGHSMGAAVGVLVAGGALPGDLKLDGLVSLGGMVHTADFAERKFGGQEPGSLMWDKPECPLSRAFLDDMRAVHSVLPLAAQIQVPWLLVHGSEDTVVPQSESEEIAAANSGANLQILHGADHVFSGVAARDMAERVGAWMRNLVGDGLQG